MTGAVARARALLGAAGLLAGVACHRSPSSAAPGGGETEDAAAPPAAATVVRPARCRAGEWTAVLAGDGGDPDLDLGDALSAGDGAAVALVHRVGGDRVAAVGFVRPDRDAALRVVDLGPTLGDAPPPLLAQSAPGAAEVFVAYHPVPRGPARPDDHGGTRPLAVRSVTADGSTALFTIDEQRDDSLAADIALTGDRGFVVWDEATGEAHGLIRGAAFAARQRVGPILDVSPKDSDAESPRVVPFGAGYAVVWIARAPDPQAPALEASDLEAPGEPRTRGWLEMILVDDRGAPTGPVRRLTPPTGHVTAFDLRIGARTNAPAANQADGPVVLVAARDDGEAVDGSGGTLLRVRAGRDSVEAPVAFTTEGLGRGGPTFVEGDGSWLAWVGPGEQLRMLGLDPAGTPAGLPSAEEAMVEGRPVLALSGGRVLVETPADGPGPLRTFICAP